LIISYAIFSTRELKLDFNIMLTFHPRARRNRLVHQFLFLVVFFRNFRIWLLNNVASDFGHQFFSVMKSHIDKRLIFFSVGEPGKKFQIFFVQFSKNADFKKTVHYFCRAYLSSHAQSKSGLQLGSFFLKEPTLVSRITRRP
jgi:hypothetical protein